MPRPAHQTIDLKVWRVRDLRDLELRRAGRSRARPGPHLHAEFEIALVEGGAQRVRHRGATHLAAPGALLVIPPGEVHSHDSLDDGVTHRSFFPDLAALRDASSTSPQSSAGTPAFRQLVIDDAELSRHIGALHRLLERPGSVLARETYAVFAAGLLVRRHGMLLGAGTRAAERTRGERGPVERAREYLHDHLDANVSLAQLGVVAGLPAHTLVREFARRVGMPPHAYHLQLRLNCAKRLLARGESPARVASAAGFVDQSHLTRHFRRHVGMPPGAYASAFVG